MGLRARPHHQPDPRRRRSPLPLPLSYTYSITPLTNSYKAAILVFVSWHRRGYLPSVRSAPPRCPALVRRPHLQNRASRAPSRPFRVAKNAFVDTRQDSVDSRRFWGPLAGPRPEPSPPLRLPLCRLPESPQSRCHRPSRLSPRPLAVSQETVFGLRVRLRDASESPEMHFFRIDISHPLLGPLSTESCLSPFGPTRRRLAGLRTARGRPED